MTGSRSLRPSTSTDMSMLLTSRNIRGRNAIEFERHAVAPQRRLGFDAADDVIPLVLSEVLPRLGDDFMQVQEFQRLRCVAQLGGLVGIVLGHVGIKIALLAGENSSQPPS